MSNVTGKRKQSRSPDPRIPDYESSEQIPEEFFCPVSNNFMSEPVRIPASGLTYNRDAVKDLYDPENLRPDLKMWVKMEAWLSRYELDPPFGHISSEKDLMAAIDSVTGRASDAHELKKQILEQRWTWLRNGGAIRCVAKFLSCPNPSAFWVVNALSIVAHPQNEDELLVPADIHPEYAFLGPISIACGSDNGEFVHGLINLMHALLTSSPDISAMAGKLGEIIKALLSYLWPVQHDLRHSYPKLLIALECLAENEEFCELMFDAEIVEKLFKLLDFSVSSAEDVSQDPDKQKVFCVLGFFMDSAQITTLKASLVILDRLCQHSERVNARLDRMVLGEIRVLSAAVNKVIYVHHENPDLFLAGFRLLGRVRYT